MKACYQSLTIFHNPRQKNLCRWEKVKKALEEIIDIELLGNRFSFRADKTIPNAKEVAEHLVEEVTRIEEQLNQKKNKIDNLKIIVLAALNIASEHLEVKRNYEDLIKSISGRSATLIHRLAAGFVEKGS